MTAAKCLYPEWCHIFVLAPHRNNWKIILRHCSLAQRGLCPAFGPAEQRRNSAWPSPPELFEDQLQDPTLNTFLGRKRNFSVHWPSAKKFFLCRPFFVNSVWCCSQSLPHPHQAGIQAPPNFPSSQLLGPGAIHGLYNTPNSHVLTANIWLPARFLFWHCSVQIITSQSFSTQNKWPQHSPTLGTINATNVEKVDCCNFWTDVLI